MLLMTDRKRCGKNSNLQFIKLKLNLNTSIISIAK